MVEALDAEEHELAKALLVESREELTRADGKASLLLAALGVGLSAILAAILAGDWSPFSLPEPYQAIWWAGAFCAGVSLISLGLAVWPKISHRTISRGVTYFGDIARYKTAAELRSALKRTETDPVERTVTQLHVIARRAVEKYESIRMGLVSLGFAAALTLSAVLAERLA